MILVDTNVLLDVFEDDPVWADWSLGQLEAARLEGLSTWEVERRIVFPHVKPVLLFVVLLNTIRSFQIFIEVFVLTRGGPLESTLTLVYHLYDRAFYHFEMGYASALAFLLLLFVGVILVVQQRVLGARPEVGR